MKREIICTDLNGNKRSAYYNIKKIITDDGIKKLEFRTYMENDKQNEWFDFKVALLDNDIIKVTDMFVGKQEHRMKGIPEALILELKRLFNKKIISSSNSKPIIDNEWRKPSATKVWQRLVIQNRAKYDSYNDVFELI